MSIFAVCHTISDGGELNVYANNGFLSVSQHHVRNISVKCQDCFSIGGEGLYFLSIKVACLGFILPRRTEKTRGTKSKAQRTRVRGDDFA